MKKSIRARVVRIGNSRGIPIPKVWFDQFNVGDDVELAIYDDALVVRRVHVPRENWAAAFKAMATRKEDAILDWQTPTDWDRGEWRW
jgi:antitoxin MazE